MKELIINALGEAYKLLLRQIPETKTKYVYVDIDNIMPINFHSFMAENNIPKNAWIAHDEQENICLCYNTEIPTTDKDKEDFKKKRFNNMNFGFIYKELTKAGYKRIGSRSDLYAEFDNTSVYEMYMNKDFNGLVKYYSLSFTKEN